MTTATRVTLDQIAELPIRERVRLGEWTNEYLARQSARRRRLTLIRAAIDEEENELEERIEE